MKSRDDKYVFDYPSECSLLKSCAPQCSGHLLKRRWKSSSSSRFRLIYRGHYFNGMANLRPLRSVLIFGNKTIFSTKSGEDQLEHVYRRPETREWTGRDFDIGPAVFGTVSAQVRRPSDRISLANFARRLIVSTIVAHDHVLNDRLQTLLQSFRLPISRVVDARLDGQT